MHANGGSAMTSTKPNNFDYPYKTIGENNSFQQMPCIFLTHMEWFLGTRRSYEEKQTKLTIHKPVEDETNGRHPKTNSITVTLKVVHLSS